MLQLHHSHGAPVLIAPEQIITIQPVIDGDGCDVRFVDGGWTIRVKESALDVARLRAAWERRYTVAQIAEYGELPLCAYLTEDGSPSFILCQKTCARNAQARADDGAPDEPPLKGIVPPGAEMAIGVVNTL